MQSRVTQQSSLSDPLLDHFVKGAVVRKPAVFRVTLRLHWIVLKGSDLGQELLVEQSHPLLLLEDVLVVEGHPFTIQFRLLLLHLFFIS